MKHNFIYTVFCSVLIAIISLSSSGGAGAVQGRDRTGSPLSGGTSCATCHNSGSFAPELSLEISDNEMAVSMYEPGKTYQMKVSITVPSGSPAGYGFQAVALKELDNTGAGSFGTPGSGMQVTELNGVSYVEQSSRSSENNFTIDWTAPETDVGEIQFYAAGNAADGGGSTANDNGVSLTDPVALNFSTVSEVDNDSATRMSLRVLGNPVGEQAVLLLEGEGNGSYQLDLLDYNGKQLQRQFISYQGMIQNFTLPTRDLNAGFYFLRLSNGLQTITKKIVKQ